MPLQSLRSAPERTSAQLIAQCRLAQLAALYEQADAGELDAPRQLDLEVVETRAVRNIELGCAGRAVTTTLLPDRYTDVEERVTILLALTREDRIHSVVYSVKVGGELTHEVLVRRGTGMWRLAEHVAAYA